MNEIILIAGILLTLWGLTEGLWTTLWLDGNSAPFTSRYTTFVWKIFRLLFRSSNDRKLSLAGPFILITTVLIWICIIWLGWTIIFWSHPHSLNAQNLSEPVDFTDVLWYVAYNMFTVGNGDFTPRGGTWQVLSSFISLTGMTMVTLSITYVLQVISAVTSKRSIAGQITSIGKTAEEFVAKQWTGEGFGAIELQLNSLSQQLATNNEQHLAFPILHYYHAARIEKSQDIAIAILDDALTLIELGVEEKYKPAETILSSARQSVSSFLTTLQSAFIEAAGETPPAPDISILKKKGIPVIADKEFQKKIEKESDRRKLILGLLNNGAWEWPSNY
jgi:hypothetical protein